MLNILAWLLLGGAVVVMLVSPLVPPETFAAYRGAIPAAILVALAGHLFTQSRKRGESVEKESQFYLDSCVLAYEQAQALLLHGNNDRAVWIAAGRALAHARELESGVLVSSHRRVLEVQKLKYRGFFDDALSNTASFFYGVDPSLPIDDAAKASTAGAGTVVSTLKSLSEKSLHSVWLAAQWPQDYVDPLDKEFSQNDRDRLTVLYRGLHEYLEHQDQWLSASGKLFPRTPDGERDS